MTGTSDVLPRHRPTRHGFSLSSTILLLPLLLVLLSSLLPSISAQLQFAIAPNPLGQAVATSVTDQGALVLQRLRTRKSLQTQQRLQGAFAARNGRLPPDESIDVYECTSLDGPQCPWLNGDEEVDQGTLAVQRLIQQLMQQRTQHAKTSPDSLSSSSADPDASEGGSAPAAVEGGEGDGGGVATKGEAIDFAQLLQHFLERTEAAKAREAEGTDPAVDADEDDEDDWMPSGDHVKASVLAGGSYLQDEGQAGGVEGEVQGDEEASDEEVEYEVVAIGEDGEERPMTDEELQHFTEQVMAGNIHIQYEDEEDAGEAEGQTEMPSAEDIEQRPVY